MQRARKKLDALQVQISVAVKLHKGQKITKKALKEIVQRAADGESLPSNVKIRGVFWRNPNRKGRLSYWRYHRGANLDFAPSGPRESGPRPESLRDAFDTLYNFIIGGEFEI